MKIKAAVTYEKGKFTFDDGVELDQIKEDQVLIKIAASGVCHTDVCALEQQVPYPLPGVLGHEGAGEVIEVGKKVHGIEKGDHVVLAYATCGYCPSCLTAHPGACYSMDRLNFGGRLDDGTTPLHKDGQDLSLFFGQSSFATYAVAHRNNVVKIDPDVDVSLMGPLGCGISTGAGTVLNYLKPEGGSTIAVYGAGAVGLSAIMAARIAGCTKIIAVDIHQNRLDLALELGATDVVDSSKGNTVEQIQAITGGVGTNYAVETSGVPSVFMDALHALAIGGKLAQVAVSGGPVTLELNLDLMWPSKTIVGVIEGDTVSKLFIPELIEYYKQGRFPFDKMVKFYDFEDIEQAFADSASGATVKPILRMPT